MEFKGTKGWHLTEGYIKDENNGTIADVFGINEIDRANALLMSKAPEMLEMLKKSRDIFLDLKHDKNLP